MGTGLDTAAYAFVAETSSAITQVQGNVNLANAAWRHMTAVCDRDTKLTVYVDGLIVNSVDPTSKSGGISSEANLIIGAIESGQYFSGKIDDVRIYNRALSEAEVKALYEFEKAKE